MPFALALLPACGVKPANAGESRVDSSAVEEESKNTDSGKKRETVLSVRIPQAMGQSVIGTDTVAVDISNVSDGYVMASYTGTASDCKMQITVPDGTLWYTADMKAVKLAEELSGESADDLDFVGRVYEYVTRHIVYDEVFAASAPVNYIPDVDQVLESGKGICMDYAALMTAMLRSQGIPAKMDIGYSGDAYHAWLSVYIKEKGWVDDVIYFDGSSWSLMDPTIGASNTSSAVKKYVGDGTNYILKYCY